MLVSDGDAAVFTLMVEFAESPPKLAVIVEVPFPADLIKPVELTVATLWLLLV